MDNEASQPATSGTTWKPVQTYMMAAVCLVIGLVVGYLLRGSAAPAPSVATVAGAQPSGDPHAGMGQQRMPSLEQMKKMADKKAEPLLAKSKADPNNAELLNQIGILYRSAHQFKEAEQYFQKSLAIDPKNVNVRTDLAACLYYGGDADGALAELQKSLTYDPKHSGALMNMGIIKWQDKHDAKGAVAAWEKLLKLNPDFPQKDVIERMITEAKQNQNTVQSSIQPKG